MLSQERMSSPLKSAGGPFAAGATQEHGANTVFRCVGSRYQARNVLSCDVTIAGPSFAKRRSQVDIRNEAAGQHSRGAPSGGQNQLAAGADTLRDRMASESDLGPRSRAERSWLVKRSGVTSPFSFDVVFVRNLVGHELPDTA